MRFEYLEHTSEAKFRAYGKTIEEAFANAGLAVTNIMVDVDKVKSEKKFDINVESSKLQALLYDFIDEIIYIRDVEGVFLSKFNLELEQGKKFMLKGEAYGDDILKYDTGSDVKSPTYDEMEIDETADGWMIQVVVDV